MEELSIKIKIADREYPMRVHPDEEERLRLAARVVNDKIKSYKEQFGINDRQDLLAMVAFDCLVEGLKLEAERNNMSQSIAGKISGIDQLVSSVLLES